MSLVCPINGAVAVLGARCPRRCPVNGAIARAGAVCPRRCPVNGAIARRGAVCPVGAGRVATLGVVGRRLL